MRSNVQSDNSDYCSACGGSGYLLCCDGCDRAFHFECLDPPLDPNISVQDLPNPWYCFICKARRNPVARESHGLFTDLVFRIERKNPTAFALPQKLRDYFEGVKTGEDGEYVDYYPLKGP